MVPLHNYPDALPKFYSHIYITNTSFWHWKLGSTTPPDLMYVGRPTIQSTICFTDVCGNLMHWYTIWDLYGIPSAKLGLVYSI